MQQKEAQGRRRSVPGQCSGDRVSWKRCWRSETGLDGVHGLDGRRGRGEFRGRDGESGTQRAGSRSKQSQSQSQSQSKSKSKPQSRSWLQPGGVAANGLGWVSPSEESS